MADARPRSEVGNHAATMRPLPGNTGDCAQAGKNAQNEDGGEGRAGAEVAGKAGEECADRPEDDGDAVDALRSEAVQQAAGGQLAQRVGPAEAEQQIAQRCGVRSMLLGHHCGGLRERRAVSKAEAAYDKQNGDDEIANAGFVAAVRQWILSARMLRASASRYHAELRSCRFVDATG